MIAYCENKIECRRQQILTVSAETFEIDEQYFGETFDPRDCHRTCDNCKNDLNSYSKNVTQEAKDIVALVRELQGDKVTMNHVMDVFRGMKHAKIVSLCHDQLHHYGKGKSWRKQDTERLFRMLVIREILTEKCELNGMGFPMSHLRIGAKCSLPQREEIMLTLTEDANETGPINNAPAEKKSRTRKSITEDDRPSLEFGAPGESSKEHAQVQMDCYRELKHLRDQVCHLEAKINQAQIADANGIPPSGVFKDSTLLAMVFLV